MPPTRARRKTDSKGEPVESRDKQLLRIFEKPGGWDLCADPVPTGASSVIALLFYAVR
jgi:hypothetical protein